MAKSNTITLESWSQNGDIINSFKTLFANIRFASMEKPLKSILVTSSGINEGKTMVSVNLAHAISSAGYKTLLIDCDLRNKSVYKMLNIQVKYGLFSILSGQCTPFEACVSTNIENLYFLDNVDDIPSPPDILSTSRFAALIDKFHELFDYIVIDTPPIKNFVDAAIIANIVDSTILVARQSKVKKANLVEAYNQLKSAKANILGTVLTFSSSRKKNDYYYAYYNRNNERVDKSKYPVKEKNISGDTENNIKSWLDESHLGRASARRSSMVRAFQASNPNSEIEKKEKKNK